MREIKFNFEKKENEVFEFNGKDVIVIPFIPFKEKIVFMSEYISTYFNPGDDVRELFFSDYSYIQAERELAVRIIDEMTNIKIFDKEDNLVVNMDDLFSSGIFDEVKSRISNYDDLVQSIWILVENSKSEIFMRKSIGSVLDNAMEYVLDFLKNFSELDLSEGGIGKLADSIREVSESLSSSPVSAMMEDSKRK